MRNEAMFRKFTAFASACAAAMLSPSSAAPGKVSAPEIVIIEKNRKEYNGIPGGAGAVKSENAA